MKLDAHKQELLESVERRQRPVPSMRLLTRRGFVSRSLALGGMTAAASVFGMSRLRGAVPHRPLDPVNPDMLFGVTSSLWAERHDIEWAVKRIAALGLQGIEPYGNQIEKYRSNPMALKRLFDAAGITFIDASNGEADQSTDFITPNRIRRPSPIMSHSRAISSSRSAPVTGSAIWGRGLQAGPATISSRGSPTRSARSAGKLLPSGSEWLLTLISGDPWNASTRCAG